MASFFWLLVTVSLLLKYHDKFFIFLKFIKIVNFIIFELFILFCWLKIVNFINQSSKLKIIFRIFSFVCFIAYFIVNNVKSLSILIENFSLIVFYDFMSLLMLIIIYTFPKNNIYILKNQLSVY